MKRSGLSRFAAVAAACALALTACARSGDDPDDDNNGGQKGDAGDYYTAGIFEKEAPGEPTDGGTLTMADYAETRSLDPTSTIATGYSGGTSLVAVYDQLVRWNEREQDLEYRLAEKVEPNDEYTEWTITLRDGVKFSDGTPVNADAVVGSFNYYLQNKGYDAAVVGPFWGGAEAVDEKTVKVTLRQGWATFPFALGKGMGFIVAPAAIKDGKDGFQPIGAGAFKYESYKPQEELVLAANPDHWDGKPHLEKLRFVWVGADETKYESLTSGQVDTALIRSIELLKQGREADVSGWVKLEGMGNVININMAEGRPGTNLKVRQALGHALDEQDLYQRAFDGLGKPSKHVFGPESKWHNEDAPAPEHDPEKAKKLLEEAKAEGFDGKIVLTASADPGSREQSMIMQAQLEAVGFTVENDFVRTIADITNKIYIERNYDFARSALSMEEADPFWRLQANMHSKSPTNSSGYADPEFDALVDELRTTEGDERKDVLQRIEARLMDQMPYVILSGAPAYVAWNDHVHGIVPSNDAMLAFDKAWLSN
ncbi:ABC transporter substrate-binding protein [Enemella sp. A6]|uniref:ABC transporter substrate-binding protein n=1 Tax=Enemella sp. A6 TaxID=3440152 RepID=UPI003EBE300E